MTPPGLNSPEHGELVLFTSQDGAVSVSATLERETVWLTQEQMAQVFQVQRPAITKHLSNIFKTGELVEETTSSVLEHMGQGDTRAYATKYYNLDAIIAVGYRVNSKRATQFRIWATAVLRQYILKGYALNDTRLQTLGRVVHILRRAENRLDAEQVLSVVQRYTAALDLLDAYDHQRIGKPEGTRADTPLAYDECRAVIDQLGFGRVSALFGNEKDDSFRGSLGAIHQTFGGAPLYPSIEEKAAHLLYFVVKNHSFTDGNKRIGAALFLYYLDKNRLMLTADGDKRIADHTLVALTLMIAESKPAERELMINLVMTFLTGDGDV